ncbi:putative signal peptide peptidase SppA [compost metagenome]
MYKGMNDTAVQLEIAMKDPLVKGILLYVNSPGGDVVASEIIHAKIKKIKEVGLPVYVSMGTVAASGGYYISAPADKIFANPSTITGSIGVVMSLTNYKELGDKLGVHQILVTSGSNKAMGNPLNEVTDENLLIYQDIVNESFNRFIEVVEDGRKIESATLRKFSDGRILSGKQAQELGLVDELGNLENTKQSLLNHLKIQDVKVISYQKQQSLFDFMNSNNQIAISQQVKEIKAEITDTQTKLMYLHQ